MQQHTLHCYVNSLYTIFVTHTHTHTHTHTPIHTHRDWACTTCRDFGFIFLTLFLQSVHVHECTHLCTHTHTHTLTHTHTHTQTELVQLAETLGSYFSHCFYKAYMCMNVHTCVHTHVHTIHAHKHYTHTHTQRLGLYHLQRLWVLISHIVFTNRTCA